MQLLIACSLAHVGNISRGFGMHDIESVVAGLKKIRDEIQAIDERSTVAHLVGLALHEALLMAWDSVRREPDDKRRAARFFRLYAIMPKD